MEGYNIGQPDGKIWFPTHFFHCYTLFYLQKNIFLINLDNTFKKKIVSAFQIRVCFYFKISLLLGFSKENSLNASQLISELHKKEFSLEGPSKKLLLHFSVQKVVLDRTFQKEFCVSILDKVLFLLQNNFLFEHSRENSLNASINYNFSQMHERNCLLKVPVKYTLKIDSSVQFFF